MVGILSVKIFNLDSHLYCHLSTRSTSKIFYFYHQLKIVMSSKFIYNLNLWKIYDLMYYLVRFFSECIKFHHYYYIFRLNLWY